MAGPNKQLGQHWLRDRTVLARIADYAELTSRDTVLEIGPGLGTLTAILLRQAGRVVSVEFDAELARKLPGQFPGTNLQVVAGDILQYDTSQLPAGYKVVANVPYYITSKIIQMHDRYQSPECCGAADAKGSCRARCCPARGYECSSGECAAVC